MKWFTIIGIIIAGLLVIALAYGFIMWFAFGGGMYFLPKPPKPEITYGEFPFRLTYELNGETKTIEDTAICEFDGYGKLTEAGQARKWKSHLKSGNDKANSLKGTNTDTVWITLLDTRKTNEIDSFGNKVLELYFFGGNGHYYMDDKLGNHGRDGQEFDYVSYMYQKEDGTIGHSGFEADEAWERYKIRLISWEPSEPIKNTFK